jgi:hypothetical protein
MPNRAKLLTAVWVSLLFSSAASAQTPATQTPATPAEPQYPKIAVGALTYFQYDAELKNRDDYNAFDVTRGYINITGDLAKNIKFRLTPDLRRVTDGSLAGSLTFRLKYGFVEFDELTPRSWLRFGLHQTPWLDFEESVNRYRVQGTMFAEREGVIPGSGEFGVGYLTRLPNRYGEINAGIYNGEGFTRPETDKRKSVQVRATIRPLPNSDGAGAQFNGLRFSGFYDAGWFAEDRPRRHGIFMASYEHRHIVGTAEWLRGTMRPAPLSANADFDGYSLFGEVRQGFEGWAGVLRFEEYDPNRHSADDSHRRTIAGVAYWLKWSAVRLGLVLNDEDVRYDRGASRPDENRLLFQTHVQF